MDTGKPKLPHDSGKKCVPEHAHINVYIGDEIVDCVTLTTARAMRATGDYFAINHGKDIKKVTVLGEIPTQLEKQLGWNMPFELRASGLNRGAASHTGRDLDGRCHKVPHYPIPYVYEGHLKKPRAEEINAGDALHV